MFLAWKLRLGGPENPKFPRRGPTMVGRAERRRYAAHPQHLCGPDPQKGSPEVTNPPPTMALAKRRRRTVENEGVGACVLVHVEGAVRRPAGIEPALEKGKMTRLKAHPRLNQKF